MIIIRVTRADGTTSAYPIDLAITEKLKYEAEVTDKPVEKGANTTDNVVAKLPVLQFDGVVSDFPIGRVANDVTRQNPATALPSKDAFDRLTAIFFARQPVIVECSFGVFESMILQTLEPEKDAASQRSFKFSCEFRQIKFEENARTKIQVAVPNVAGGDNRGNRDGKVFHNSDVTYVVSFPHGGIGIFITRDQLIAKFGQPVLTTTKAEREASDSTGEQMAPLDGVQDHYNTFNVKGSTPDGTIDATSGKKEYKHLYNPFGSKIGGFTKKNANGEWVDNEGRVVEKPRPPKHDGQVSTWWDHVASPKQPTERTTPRTPINALTKRTPINAGGGD